MLSLVVNYQYINGMYHKTTSSVLQVYCSISVGNCLYTYGKLIVPNTSFTEHLSVYIFNTYCTLTCKTVMDSCFTRR